MPQDRNPSRIPSLRRLAFAWAFIFAFGFAAAAFAEDSGDDFYKGKLLRVIVPTPTGGLYDAFARLIAEHMPRHISGNPQIIVQNMGGAAGLVAANYVANVAPRDGTVFAAGHSSTMIASVLSPEQARYDANQLSWIGSITRDPFVSYVWHTSPVQSLKDLETKEATFGGNAVGAASIDYAIVAKAFFGLKIKIITGYANSTDVKLAMERGEINGTFGNGWSSLKADEPTWLSEHKIILLTQFGLTRHPEMPDVPMFIDLAKNEADHQALELLLARQEFSKTYYAPPQIPAARLNILRRAFDATVKDPAFLADAAKMGAPVSGPATGEEVATATKRISTTPPSVVERIENVFAQFHAGN
jgi:tripartite-type tricarboxylate transporter receptor subunit TctC